MAAAPATVSNPTFRSRLVASVLTSPRESAFAQFGAPADWRRAGKAPMADPASGRSTFTVAEARRRLGQFISGAIKLTSPSELLDYLKSQFVRIERQTFYNNGKSSQTVLVDELSLGRQPISAIGSPRLDKLASDLGRRAAAEPAPAPHHKVIKWLDASRLSWRSNPPGYTDWAVAKMGITAALKDNLVGYTVATVGLAAPSAAGQPRKAFRCAALPADTQRSLYSMMIATKPAADRTRLSGQFMQLQGPDRERLLSRHFDFAPGMPEGSQVGRLVAYIGHAGNNARKPLECTPNADATRTMLFTWLTANAPTRIPAGCGPSVFAKLPPNQQDALLDRSFVRDAKWTARTTILLRFGPLALATQMHHSLSAAAMASSCSGPDRAQISQREFWSGWDKERRENDKDDGNIINFPDAMDRIRRSKDGGNNSMPGPLPAGEAFGGITRSDPVVRSGSAIVLVDREDSPITDVFRVVAGEYRKLAVSSPHDLPPHDYPREVLGTPQGFVRVSNDRSLTYLDDRKIEHNEDGPSRIDSKGKPVGWAFNGSTYSTSSEWKERLETEGRLVSEPEPAPAPLPMENGSISGRHEREKSSLPGFGGRR